MPTDTNLSSLSQDSLEVLAHFGPEAPQKLNAYACALEDALLESLKHQQSQAEQIASYAAHADEMLALLTSLKDQHDALQHILTDPEALLSYVKGFFAPDGPYPGMALITRTPIATTYHG